MAEAEGEARRQPQPEVLRVDEPLALAELAALRERTYRLISRALLYPEEQRLRSLSAGAVELRDGGAKLARFAFFLQWQRLLDAAEELGRHEPGDVERRYTSLFAVGTREVPCPPYESSYRDGDVAETGWVMAELQRRYATAGLELSADVREEHDHVALELEFMALLCAREAEAGDRADAAARLRRDQLDFLDRHLCAWFPEFARRLMVEDPGGLHARVARAAHDFLVHDRDLLAALDAAEAVA